MSLYEHKIVVTILSEDENIDDDDSLSSLEYEMTYGEYMGVVNTESVNKLTKEEAIQRCYDLGGEPDFFFYDYDEDE